MAQMQRQWTIRGDTLILYDGQTQQYSVDTPADKGVVSTLISEEQLQRELKDAGIELPKYRRTEKKALPSI